MLTYRFTGNRALFRRRFPVLSIVYSFYFRDWFPVPPQRLRQVPRPGRYEAVPVAGRTGPLCQDPEESADDTDNDDQQDDPDGCPFLVGHQAVDPECGAEGQDIGQDCVKETFLQVEHCA